MARRKGYRTYARRARRVGSSGFKALLKPFLVGALVGMFSDKIPYIGGIEPMATGAAGGFLVKKSITGAGAGAAGAFVGSRYLKGFTGQTNNAAW